MRYQFIGRWVRGFGTFMSLTSKLMNKSPIEMERERILVFWQQYGLQATTDAFQIKRSTLFLWKKRKRENRLAPLSKRPRHVRRPTTSLQVASAVSKWRRALPFLGKDKLKSILQKQEGIAVSASTIGRIIQRENLPSAPRQYVARTKRKIKRDRLPPDYPLKQPSDLVGMDTVVLQEQGQKRYIISAIDYVSRIVVSRVYSSPCSQHAKDLLLRMRIALGVPILGVNTDNGSEFLAMYQKACIAMSIQHFFTYPRTPKMNPFAERFNRTLQEEARFPLFHESLDVWNNYVSHYVMLYNFFRPHYSLSYKTPVDILLLSKKSNMSWTHTDD